jgi:hypothetical protein
VVQFRHGSLSRTELGRIARFGCVGLIGVGVNSALLWLLTDGAHFYYLVSSVVATEVAILSNFALNQALDLCVDQRRPPVGREADEVQRRLIQRPRRDGLAAFRAEAIRGFELSGR